MWKIVVGIGLLLAISAGVVLFVPWDDHREADVEFSYLGSWEMASDLWMYGEMAVGELSGLTYDAERDVYYAVSDNRGDAGTPGKLFTVDIDADADGIAGVTILDVTFLDSDLGPERSAYGSGEIDAEEVVLLPDDRIIVSSERDGDGVPWIRIFDLDGNWLEEIPVPDRFHPGPNTGVRSNLAFEAMALSSDGGLLYVANEQALIQDGPMADVEQGTWVRISCYDLAQQTPSVVAEFAYLTEPIFAYPSDGTYADNGVVAMLDPGDLMPRFDLLVLERAYSSGIGNHVELFGVVLANATDVRTAHSLSDASALVAVAKEPLVAMSAINEMTDMPLFPDNLEAMTIGCPLDDGTNVLYLISDNNFNASQRNQMVALSIGERSFASGSAGPR